MAFGTLELLGIKLEKLNLVIEPEPAGALIGRTSVIDDGGKKTPLEHVIKDAIQKQQKTTEFGGDITDRAVMEVAARYDVMEAISQYKDKSKDPNVKISAEVAENFTKECIKKKVLTNIFLKKKCLDLGINESYKGIKVQTLALELEHSTLETAEKRGDWILDYLNRIPKDIEKNGVKEPSLKGQVARKILTDELMEVLKKIPPLTLEMTINGKNYKNANAVLALLTAYNMELNLTQFSEVMGIIKKNEQEIWDSARSPTLETPKTLKDRGNQLECQVAALAQMKGTESEKSIAGKILIDELMETLKKIPPLAFNVTIDGKVYKNGKAILVLLNEHNIDLSLTQLSEILDLVKKNQGRIGSEGAKLIKNQIKKFGEKVLEADEVDDSKKLNALKNDFVKAFDVKDGGFGENGLKKHLKKSWNRFEKSCRKILRYLTGKQSEYEKSKEARTAAGFGFEAIGKLLNVEIKEREQAEVTAQQMAASPLQSGQESTLGPKFELVMQHYAKSNSSLKGTGAEQSVSELRQKYESGKKPPQPASPRKPIFTGAAQGVSTLREVFKPKTEESTAKQPQVRTKPPEPLERRPAKNPSTSSKLIDLAEPSPQPASTVPPTGTALPDDSRRRP